MYDYFVSGDANNTRSYLASYANVLLKKEGAVSDKLRSTMDQQGGPKQNKTMVRLVPHNFTKSLLYRG